MENTKKQRSYLGNKLLLSDIKKDKKIFLDDVYIKENCSVSPIGKDIQLKTYFDTADNYFASIGINISRNAYKNNPICEYIVRYDSNIERIGFLSDMPDTFKIFANVKDPLSKFYEYFGNSVRDIIPAGLNVDIMQVISEIRPIVNVTKKREKYKVSHINGLKMTITFDMAEYSSPLIRDITKLNEMELVSESYDKSDEVEAFTKHCILENPNLIRLRHSDLFIAKEYLFCEKDKNRLTLEEMRKQNLLKSLMEKSSEEDK